MDENKMREILNLMNEYKMQDQHLKCLVDEIRYAAERNQVFSELPSYNFTIRETVMQISHEVVSKAMDLAQFYHHFVEELDNAVKEYISMDYEGRCGNCHEYLPEEDLYCRHCGTKKGEGAFQPYENIMECIYGPMPVEREHKCPKCGYEWTNCVMIDTEKYCPKCGTNIHDGTTLQDEIASLFQ